MNFKESGIEWIGQIPVHWNTLSVNKAYEVKLGKMLQPNLQDERDVKVPYLKAMNVQEGYLSLDKIEEMYCSVHELKNLNLEIGDLVVCEGGEVARSAIIKEKLEGFIFQNSVHRVKGSKKGNTRFLHYLLVTLRASGFINILVNKATIAHFTKDKFNSLKIALPSLNEQLIISDYLDDECNKIENMIKAKQKLIALLEQQRQSIITEAVTKGLNQNVKMKDSGVEWIGKIPEHWSISAFKRISKRVEVGIAEAATHAYRDSGIPIIRATNLKDGKFNEDELLYLSEEFAEKNNSKYIFANDLLTVRTGNAGLTGVVPKSLNMSQCFTMLISTLNDNVNPYFYSYFLNASPGKVYFELTAWGTAQKNISVPILKEMVVPVLPLAEQIEIVRYLQANDEKVDNLILRLNKQIEKLKEYRQSLIYEAVTGKIDVRNMELDEVR